MEYIDENPIDEVYRIREEILKEYGGIKGWNKHIDENHSKWVSMVFKFLSEKEFDELRNI